MNDKNEQKKKFDAMRLVLCGRSGAGKTHQGSHYILQLVKQRFISAKRLLLFSATWKTDPSVQELIAYCQSKNKRFMEDHCFEQIDTELIMKIYENQKKIKESKPDKLKSWIIYFDDQITSDLWKHTSRSKVLLSCFTIGRHYQLSLVVGIQKLIGCIAPTLREQFTHLALFQMGSTNELLDILKAYNECRGCDIKKAVDQLFEIYLDAIQQDNEHGCLVIHVMKRLGKGRFERGLGTGWFYDIQGDLK